MGLIRIEIELDKCIDNVKNARCPYAASARTPFSGFAEDYYCKAANNRITSGYVEWERDVNPIPPWCPKLIKEE